MNKLVLKQISRSIIFMFVILAFTGCTDLYRMGLVAEVEFNETSVAADAETLMVDPENWTTR